MPNTTQCLAHGTEDVRWIDNHGVTLDGTGEPYCGTCLDMNEDDPRATVGGCGTQGCLRCENAD
jgi:hypothetical protein